LLPDAGDPAPEGDAVKVGAFKKSVIPNGGNAVRYYYTGQAGAGHKSLPHDAGKRTAGKINRDVFGTFAFQHSTDACKVAHVQFDCVCCGDGIVCLCI